MADALNEDMTGEAALPEDMETLSASDMPDAPHAPADSVPSDALDADTGTISTGVPFIPEDISEEPEDAPDATAPATSSARQEAPASSNGSESDAAAKADDKPHPRRVPKQSAHEKLRGGISYRTRTIISFVAVALFTAGASLGIVAFIWNQFFTMYAANNIENLTEQTANRIGATYQETLKLDEATLIPAQQLADSSDELGVIVTDLEGNIVFNSTDALPPEAALTQGPSAAAQIALSSIKSNGVQVANLRVWASGSNTLMSNVDREFQRDTFMALLYAGLFSIIFSVVVGVVFARSLVRPVERISRTARELSEGNLTARTGMSGNNELAKLGETMDEMAERFERDHRLEQQLTSDVAHELRTPLMAIQATVEAMIDGVYDKDDEHLMLVATEVGRLSKLVDALLRLSRMEMRSQPMREEVVDLSELAEEVLVSHEAFIEDSGLSIHMNVQPDIKVIGDVDMIKQAVTNLVSNAVRYTDEGGSITLSVAREGRMAAFSVADTGIGLSPEEAKMVFSRFWRADAGRAKESGGLGVGLSLVKEIVERHHGRVTVSGEKGVGSTFTILLPLYDEEKSIAQARLAVRVMERRQKAQSGKK